MSDSREREASPQANIDYAEHNGSSAHIYDPVGLLEQAQSSPIRIFEKADFASPIEYAYLNLEPVEARDGRPALGVSGHVQLDRSRSDLSQLLKNFRTGLDKSSRKDRDISVAPTNFINCFLMVDNESGFRSLIEFYSDGSIYLMNHRLGTNSADKDSKAELFAKPTAIIDEAAFLRGATRVFMYSLDHANGSTMRRKIVNLKRIYEFGKTVTPIKRTLLRTLNSTDQQNQAQKAPQRDSKAAPSPAKPSAASASPTPEQLGIDVVEGQVTLDEIGGLSDVKSRLREIATSFKETETMVKWGAERPQGILLYGEPGTGKNMLVEALANEIEATIWSIQSSDIYNKWLGDSEQRIKDIFQRARSIKVPTILLFDEFDSIIGITEEVGPGGGSQARNAVAGIFKQEMNTLADENPNVLVVAITNHLDRIDDALTRSGRFDHRIYVPMPDERARSQIASNIIGRVILASETSGFSPYGGDINTDEIAQASEGMSGADIAEVFRRIALQKAMQEARNGSTEPIGQFDILKTIQDFRTGL